MDLSDWLERHGLTKYAALFAQHAIGLDVLAQLTDQELRELDIPLGDRKRLLPSSAAGRSSPLRGSPSWS